MFKKDADLAEVRGVVGHEMGHYVRKHILLGQLLTGLSLVLGFFLIDRLFPTAMRLTGAKGVTGIADPAGLPVFSILATVFSLLATPATNSVSRWIESDADHFSVVHFNEPDGLAKALVKTIEYRASSPSALEEFVFLRPPVRRSAGPRDDGLEGGASEDAAARRADALGPIDIHRRVKTGFPSSSMEEGQGGGVASELPQNPRVGADL